MLLTVDPAYAADVDPAWVVQVVTAALAASRPCTPPAVEVSVTVGNEALLHDLNKRYRGVDRPTDVLAFPLQGDLGVPRHSRHPRHSRESGNPIVTPAAADRQLGDVVISYPRVRRQARTYGHTEQHELAYLLIHGVLHLLGYDHDRDEDFAAMCEQEERILGRLGRTDNP